MATTRSSRRAVFRRIARTSYCDWPAYTAMPLYDRGSAGGLEEDAHTLASVRFDHDAHESITGFVAHWPLSYVELDAHDCYTDSTTYDMETVFRTFLFSFAYHSRGPVTVSAGFGAPDRTVKVISEFIGTSWRRPSSRPFHRPPDRHRDTEFRTLSPTAPRRSEPRSYSPRSRRTPRPLATRRRSANRTRARATGSGGS